MRDDTGHDGSLPLIGVNTFLPKDHGGEIATGIELIRSTEEEKGQQIANVQAFQKARNALAPAGRPHMRTAPTPPTNRNPFTPGSSPGQALSVARRAESKGLAWPTCRTPRGTARTCSTR
jgi:methylmalonyl-CoA mutase